MAQQLEQEFQTQLGPKDQIIVGNWTDEALLEGYEFDIILADYLIGAIDGFSPYFQVRHFFSLILNACDIGCRMKLFHV